jgi:hypothetical protein
MALVIDNILETHDGAEPRVLRHEIRRMLTAVVRPGDDDNGEAVTVVADRARVSTRTVYRALADDEWQDGVFVNETISLDIADRLCRACGTHLALENARLRWSDGTITPYISLRSRIDR